MTYKDQFVAEVKCNGRILRIRDDAVYLPFGSEYSLLLKNLNSRRASVKIHIDGVDVIDGSSLILGPNETTELEGFLSGNVARNRFRFIQKTKEIQDYRGDKIDDGFIRIEFAFEKEKPELIKKTIIHEEHHHHHHHRYPSYYWLPFSTYYGWNDEVKYTCDNKFTGGETQSSASPVENLSNESVKMSNSAFFNQSSARDIGIEMVDSVPLDDEGITVKGSECNQQFRYGTIGELEQSQTIIIRLKGNTSGGSTIQEPLTVKRRLQCKVCGTKSKSSFKYCPNCGAFLEE
jgi:hypothetical protein